MTMPEALFTLPFDPLCSKTLPFLHHKQRMILFKRIQKTMIHDQQLALFQLHHDFLEKNFWIFRYVNASGFYRENAKTPAFQISIHVLQENLHLVFLRHILVYNIYTTH